MLSALVAACGPGRNQNVEDSAPMAGDGGVSWGVDGGNTGAFGDAREAAAPRSYPDADFSVELPYMGAGVTRDVSVEARAGRVDVHLLVDTTGSFDGEIDELQRELMNTVVPGLRSRIPSLTLGVSRFEDMPFSPWGDDSDRPFTLLVPQTDQFSRVLSGVQRLDMPIGRGGDGPESWVEALYQAATGEGIRSRGNMILTSPWRPMSGTGPIGGVGWREQSTRLIVLVTDAPSHEGADYISQVPTAHSSSEALAALRARGIRVLGIASGDPARTGLESFAMGTNAIAPPESGACRTGTGTIVRSPVDGVCPQVYDISPTGMGLSRAVVDSIARLLDTAVYREAWGEPADDEHMFVSALEALPAEIPAGAGSSQPERVDLRPITGVDGLDDTYRDVSARLTLRFRIHLRNRTVPSEEWPQSFLLRVVLMGDGEILREVSIRVTVPEGPKSDVIGTDATFDGTSTSDGGAAPVDAFDARSDGGGDAQVLDAVDVLVPTDVISRDGSEAHEASLDAGVDAGAAEPDVADVTAPVDAAGPEATIDVAADSSPDAVGSTDAAGDPPADAREPDASIDAPDGPDA